MGVKPRAFQILFVFLTLGSVIVSTLVFFVVAHRIGSESIKKEAMKTVCATAIGKVDSLLNRLHYQKHRLGEFLAVEASRCGNVNPKQFESCVKGAAAQFVEVQKTQSIFIETSEPKVVLRLGEPSRETVFDPNLKEGQLARFYSGGTENPYYVIQAESADHKSRVAAKFFAKELASIFANDNLGENGESFLADSNGLFLTPHKYHVEAGISHPIDAKPMVACLGGKSGETAGLDYAGVAIIHGFRYVPEIGGGCVMAHIDQKEAFAEIDKFSKKWWSASMLMWVVLGVVAYLMSKWLGRELKENLDNVTKAGNELLKSEGTVRALMNTSNDMVYLLDSNGVVLEGNNSAAKGLGKAEPGEIIGHSFFDLLPPELVETKRAKMEEVLKTRKPANFEVTWAGQYHDVTIYPVLEAGDTIAKLAVYAHDITRRLRANEEYKTLTETSGDGFWVTDLSGRFTDVNEAYCSMVGYGREEFLGMSISDIDAVETPEETASHIKTLVDKGYLRFETRHRRKDGAIIDVEVSVTYNKLLGEKIYCFLRDITFRKKAELALSRAYKEYQTIIHTTADGFYILDKDFRFVEANEAYCNLTGYSRDELLKMNIDDVKTSEGREDTPATAASIIRQGFNRFESFHRRKDGSLVLMEVTSSYDEQEGGRFYTFVHDITYRKRNELALKRASDEYQTLIRTTTDGFSIVDGEGRFVDVNEAFLKLTGYSREELLKMHIRQIRPQDDAHEITANIETIKKRGFHRFESRYLRKDGKVVETEVSVAYDGYAGGHFYSFVRDITGLKRSEQAIKRAYVEFQTIIKTSIDGFIVLDGKGMFIEVNESYCKMLGYGREEFLKMNIDDVKAPELRPNTTPIMKKVKEQRFDRWETTHLRKDGARVDLEVTSTFDDYMGGRYYCFMRDITEQKAIQNRVRESEDRLRVIFEEASVGMALFLEEGPCVMANEVCASIIGATHEQLLGQNFRDIESWRQSGMLDAALRALNEDERVRVEAELISSFGRYLILDFLATPVMVGNRRHLLVMITDVTLLKRADAEMEKINRELTVRTRQAEEASRTKSEFLASMSHEIRTPLNAIIGLTHILGQTALNIRQRDQLTKIHSSAELLLGVINDVLDFSKIEAGMLELESVPFDLGDALEHISAIVSEKAKEKNLELLYSIRPDVPLILVGDPLRFSQVVLNLLTNAVKFTQTGHVLLSVSIASVLESGDGAVIKFSVADTGIGITDEQMKKLFLPFSQADSSTTRRYGGTGLGLALCKRLVEIMKGTIYGESEPGKGSVFSFELPFGFQEGAHTFCPLVPEQLRGLHALVVDDNAMSLGIMKEMLESFSFTVTTVESVNAALEELERASFYLSNPYRLVLMDWRMPDMDGITGAKLILRDKKISDVPIVLMFSAFGDEVATQQAREAGIKHFLHKPLQPTNLLNVILEAFDIKGHESERRAIKRAIPDLTTLLRGSIVILVDDNAINREVGQALLVSAGIVAVVAKSGRECLEILEGSPEQFDAVFMDIQMPEMDGYEATRMIRKNPRFKDLPIIALTAHAMEDEKKKCFNAGMNDHISKPIQLDMLSKVLLKWLAPKWAQNNHMAYNEVITRLPAVENGDGGGPGEGILPLSLPGINLEQFISRCGGDDQLAFRLLGKFLADQSGVVEKVYLALGRKDFDSIAQSAHLIKGIAGNLSAANLQRAAGFLEKSAVNRDLPAIAIYAEDFKNELNLVLNGVSSLETNHSVAKTAANLGAVADPDAFKQACGELYNLLCKHSTKSDNLLRSMMDMVRGTELESGMEKVTKYAGQFDFEMAAEALKGLMNI